MSRAAARVAVVHGGRGGPGGGCTRTPPRRYATLPGQQGSEPHPAAAPTRGRPFVGRPGAPPPTSRGTPAAVIRGNCRRTSSPHSPTEPLPPPPPPPAPSASSRVAVVRPPGHSSLYHRPAATQQPNPPLPPPLKPPHPPNFQHCPQRTSISSSAFSKSTVFNATARPVATSTPLKTCPKLPTPMRSPMMYWSAMAGWGGRGGAGGKAARPRKGAGRAAAGAAAAAATPLPLGCSPTMPRARAGRKGGSLMPSAAAGRWMDRPPAPARGRRRRATRRAVAAVDALVSVAAGNGARPGGWAAAGGSVGAGAA